jgi:hypothetical protein
MTTKQEAPTPNFRSGSDSSSAGPHAMNGSPSVGIDRPSPREKALLALWGLK